MEALGRPTIQKLSEWCQHFSIAPEHRSATLLTAGIEFSDTLLGNMVTAPALVRESDWFEKYWPEGDSCAGYVSIAKTPSQSLCGSYLGRAIIANGKHEHDLSLIHCSYDYRPSVGKYCVMAGEGSFSDFRSSPGGASTW